MKQRRRQCLCLCLCRTVYCTWPALWCAPGIAPASATSTLCRSVVCQSASVFVKRTPSPFPPVFERACTRCSSLSHQNVMVLFVVLPATSLTRQSSIIFVGAKKHVGCRTYAHTCGRAYRHLGHHHCLWSVMRFMPRKPEPTLPRLDTPFELDTLSTSRYPQSPPLAPHFAHRRLNSPCIQAACG